LLRPTRLYSPAVIFPSYGTDEKEGMETGMGRVEGRSKAALS